MYLLFYFVAMKSHKYLDEVKNICKKRHLTVEDILVELKKKHPKVWIATVYRAVNFLVKTWEMRKIENIDKIAYYETIVDSHIHFIDEETWEIIDIPVDKFQLDNSLFETITDIRIIWKLKNLPN